MPLLAVHKSGIYRPIHSGDRPRNKFGVEYSPFPDHRKAVALLHHVLHLAGMGYPQLFVNGDSGVRQHFEQSGMSVRMVFGVVEDFEMCLQVGWLEDRLCSKRVIFRETNHQPTSLYLFDSEPKVVYRQCHKRRIHLSR